MTESHDTQNVSGVSNTRAARAETRHSQTRRTKTKQPRQKRLLIGRLLTFVLPVLVIGLSIAGVMIMSALKPEPEEKDDPIKAVPVLTALAVQDDVTLRVTTQGEVQPRTEINIVPQVSGRITYMSPNFIEGGQFVKGETLIKIEAIEYELRVVQARANVAQAQTALTREKTEADIALADWQDIGSGKAPSALTLREPQMAEAAARLASAQAQLDEAKLLLSRTVIPAPFTGRVTMRHIDAGEFVTTGTRLGEVYSVAVMDVRLPLTNDELRRAGLQLGYQARKGSAPITVDLSANVGGVNARWTGQIVRTDSRFDSQTRVLYAYAEVRDPFGAGSDKGVPIAPGLFVTGAIGGQTFNDVTTIPRAALRGTNQVYVANTDNSLSVKTVDVISSDRRQAIIHAGLDVGASVITSPIRSVSDGMKIAIVDKASDLGPQVKENEAEEKADDDAQVVSEEASP